MHIKHDMDEVLNAVSLELQYQRNKWVDIDDKNTVGDFLLYMQRELDKAVRPDTGYVAPGFGEDAAMDGVRKVVAIGVQAMRRYGVGTMTGRG